MILFAAAVFLHPQTSRGEVAKSTMVETNVAYLRIDQTEKNLPDEISSALTALETTNDLTGIVLDLRFATGSDSDDVKPVESLLEGKKLPLAILVNAQTSGATVTLAEDLREADAGLVFGTATANLQPDISISVNANDEKNFIENPYGMTETNVNYGADTNFLPFGDIDHTTEADLVRDKVKDGDEDDTTGSGNPAPPQRPFIRDPVMARGVDFIKGVAALHLSEK